MPCSAVPDQTPYNTTSDQGHHCLHYINNIYLFIYLGLYLFILLNYLFSVLWLLRIDISSHKKCFAISNRGRAELAERHHVPHPSRAELVPLYTFCTIPVNPFMPNGLFYLKPLDKSIRLYRGVWVVFIIIMFCGDF